MNKTKNCFFKKIEIEEKPLARLAKDKREDSNKIRNGRGESTTDNMQIQRIIRHYYEQINPNKLDNLEYIHKFLETDNLPGLNH